MTTKEIRKLIESNSNYWEKRALENKLNIIENELDYVKRLESIYKEANKQIDEKLARVYARYANENKITLDEAYQKLPKAMEKEYKNDVEDYIRKAESGNPKWKQYLLNQSIMHKHSVLDQLRTEFRSVIYDIDMETTGGKFLEKIYANSNYYAQYSNDEDNFTKVDPDKIKRLLEENWSGGGNFSEAIWKNKEQLVKALDDILIKGFAVGDNYDKMAEKLAKRMDTSTNNAKRLIMTESARMDNEGLLDYYKRTNIEKLLFVATLDERTSEICREMDGEIINIEDAQIGLNVPPLHPYCRSVISPYYDFHEVKTREYRDPETGKSKRGKNRTYAQYVEEELGDKEQAKAIVSIRNDLKTLIKAVGSMKTISLDNNEQYAMNQYVSSESYKINDQLRRNEKVDQVKLEDLDNALDKLVEYEGWVKRNLTPIDLDEFLEEHQIGSIVEYPAYTSTEIKDWYQPEDKVFMLIYSRKGKILGKNNQTEKNEVLFKRNSRFKVLDVIYDEKTKKYTVIMEEVFKDIDPEDMKKQQKKIDAFLRNLNKKRK